MDSKGARSNISADQQLRNRIDNISFESVRQQQLLPLDANVPYELVRTIETPLENPSEFDLTSGSETWVTNVKISNGRKMQRVWKSLQPDPLNPPISIQNENYSEINPKMEEENPNDYHNVLLEPKNEPDGPLRSLKYQRWFKTPDFTLKPKPLNELEPSGDTELTEINLSHPESQLSFPKIQSTAYLTKVKMDPKDFYNHNGDDFNTAQNVNIPNYQSPCESINGNQFTLVSGTDCEQAMEKVERIREWISPHTTMTANSFACAEPTELSMGKSSNLETRCSNTNTVTEKFPNITNKSNYDDRINGQSIMDQVKGQGHFENGSQFSSYLGKFIDCPNPHPKERPITPPFPTPLLHSATKIASQFYSKRCSSKSQQQSQQPDMNEGSESRTTFVPDEEMLSSFRDISFHYEPKNENLKNLAPTGFSINFNYPSGSLSKSDTSYSKGNHASSYFDEKTSKKSSKMDTSEPAPVPDFIRDYQGIVDTKDNDKVSSNTSILMTAKGYKIETIKPPSPCRITSNSSMIPLIQSEATVGTMSQSQHALVNSGFYSDNGISIPSTAVGGRRQPRSVRNRPYSSEISDTEWKTHGVYDEFCQHTEKPVFKINNLETSTWPIDLRGPQSCLSHKQPMNQGSKASIQPSSFYQNHPHTSNSPNKSDQMHVGDRSQNNNTSQRDMVMKSSNDIVQLQGKRPPTSKSDHYLELCPGKLGYWKQMFISGNEKLYGITKTTATDTKASKQTSRNKLRSAGSTSSSKGSIPSSPTSSKNFIQENIAKIKGSLKGLSAAPKMPTEERPPLPKAGGSKSQSKQVKVSSLSKKATKPNLKLQKVQPNTAQKILNIVEATEGALGATSNDNKPKIKRKVKVSGTVPKTDVQKLSNLKPDPYYLQASLSERQIINEVVKADLDAILERDAGKKTAEFLATALVDSAESRGTIPAIKTGTHWAHGTTSTPLHRNPFEDPQFQMIGNTKRGVSTLNNKPLAVPKKPDVSVGTSGNKKILPSPNPKPKARK